ncbi:homocysteine S-methyltransferase [Streptomyces sp. NPDC057702]|uniref:homocysteine S-methyltransferase n=1 Tax=unclassified Streptomyces TaxID=2593676 RepID=UPI00369AC7AE
MTPAAEPPRHGDPPGPVPPAGSRPTLAQALARGALVLDGGLSNQLVAQGCDLSDDLWSARLLDDDPAQIEAAHAAYVRAGAQVLITASYQVSYQGFARRGLDRRQVDALLRQSVHLARRAAARAGADYPRADQPETGDPGTGNPAAAGPHHGAEGRRTTSGRGEAASPGGRSGPSGDTTARAREEPARADLATDRAGGGEPGGGEPARARTAASGTVWVAGSVGPYGAVLADGSEYRGRYGLSVRELTDFHRPRIAALASARPDALALETVPDIDEAEAMLWAAESHPIPVWLSYSIQGRTTRAGQPLERAFALAADNDQVIAVGVNCCTPADADGAVRLAALVTGKPVVVYPNSGEGWDATARDWRGHHTFDPRRVAAWQAEGARLIGGCCRVAPDRIADLAKAMHG